MHICTFLHILESTSRSSQRYLGRYDYSLASSPDTVCPLSGSCSSAHTFARRFKPRLTTTPLRFT